MCTSKHHLPNHSISKMFKIIFSTKLLKKMSISSSQMTKIKTATIFKQAIPAYLYKLLVDSIKILKLTFTNTQSNSNQRDFKSKLNMR